MGAVARISDRLIAASGFEVTQVGLHNNNC